MILCSSKAIFLSAECKAFRFRRGSWGLSGLHHRPASQAQQQALSPPPQSDTCWRSHAAEIRSRFAEDWLGAICEPPLGSEHPQDHGLPLSALTNTTAGGREKGVSPDTLVVWLNFPFRHLIYSLSSSGPAEKNDLFLHPRSTSLPSIVSPKVVL